MTKKKIFAYIAVLCVICHVVMIGNMQPAYANEENKSSTQTESYRNIDEYLQKCVNNARIPALSVSIVNKQETLFSQSYGECAGNDIPFLLGSVSKSFTAVCIMQLAEQQKIDLAAAISTYLLNATDGEKITVSQLLNHTSGLGEWRHTLLVWIWLGYRKRASVRASIAS